MSLRSTDTPSTSSRSTPISSMRLGMPSIDSFCFSAFKLFKCCSVSSICCSTLRSCRTSWLNCFPVPSSTLANASASSNMSSNISVIVTSTVDLRTTQPKNDECLLLRGSLCAACSLGIPRQCLFLCANQVVSDCEYQSHRPRNRSGHSVVQ